MLADERRENKSSDNEKVIEMAAMEKQVRILLERLDSLRASIGTGDDDGKQKMDGGEV